jgi:hypothetical protein
LSAQLNWLQEATAERMHANANIGAIMPHSAAIFWILLPNLQASEGDCVFAFKSFLHLAEQKF